MILDAVRKHYLDLWGEPSRVIPLYGKEYHIDIYKWDASVHPEGVTMYATVGVSAFPQPGRAPGHCLEFFTGLFPEKDEIATVLADVATYSVSHQEPIGDEHSITWLEPTVARDRHV